MRWWGGRLQVALGKLDIWLLKDRLAHWSVTDMTSWELPSERCSQCVALQAASMCAAVKASHSAAMVSLFKVPKKVSPTICLNPEDSLWFLLQAPACKPFSTNCNGLRQVPCYVAWGKLASAVSCGSPHGKVARTGLVRYRSRCWFGYRYKDHVFQNIILRS